ncbi:hypothetical protein [Streptomyces sp. NPDC002588]|uniref:hypothetical protein n=1 Tax=Streptomyces sp. NPDC002588 TaxID=3154419 RepID=UPI0033171F7D
MTTPTVVFSNGDRNKLIVALLGLTSVIVSLLAVILFLVTGASVTVIAIVGAGAFTGTFTLTLAGAKAAGVLKSDAAE